jgi:hypothetical protein
MLLLSESQPVVQYSSMMALTQGSRKLSQSWLDVCDVCQALLTPNTISVSDAAWHASTSALVTVLHNTHNHQKRNATKHNMNIIVVARQQLIYTCTNSNLLDGTENACKHTALQLNIKLRVMSTFTRYRHQQHIATKNG